MAINLKRKVDCPYCGAMNAIDFKDFCLDVSIYEREMGPETIYDIDVTDQICVVCKKSFQVRGWISEYPEGAYNNDDFQVIAID